MHIHVSEIEVGWKFVPSLFSHVRGRYLPLGTYHLMLKNTWAGKNLPRVKPRKNVAGKWAGTGWDGLGWVDALALLGVPGQSCA